MAKAEAKEATTETLPIPERFAPTITVRAIAAITADEFGILLSLLMSTSRARTIVWPRQAAMWLVRRHTRATLVEIGRRFGGFDHTTVLHAIRQVDALRDRDQAFAERLEILGHRINVAEATMAAQATTPWTPREEVPKAPVEAALQPAVVDLRPAPSAMIESRVMFAVGVYLAARAELEKCQWAKGESAARQRTEAAFRDLCVAHRGDGKAQGRSA